MPSPVTPDPEKLDRFLEQGGEFFSWNKGKNTPNILLNLAERISSPPFPIPPEARHGHVIKSLSEMRI